MKTTAERIEEVNGTAAKAPAAPERVPDQGKSDQADAPTGTRAPAAGAHEEDLPKVAPASPRSEIAFTPGMSAVDAPFCSTCGVRMRPAGSCFVCESCGTTSGCS